MIKLISNTNEDYVDHKRINPQFSIIVSSNSFEPDEEEICSLFTSFMHAMGYNKKKSISYEEV